MPPKSKAPANPQPPGADSVETKTADNQIDLFNEPITEPQAAKQISKPMHLQANETTNLIDLPFVFLSDRLNWGDFKKAIHECGLIWGLPEWMTTITYKGIEWHSLISEHQVDLNKYFPEVQKTQAGDGFSSKSSTLGNKLASLLGRPKSLADSISSVQFCCLTTVEYESERKLPSRQKLWSWMVRSLRGSKPAPGPYHYLVDEVQTYDISYLFKRLIDVLEQVTICSLDDELEIIIKMDFKPSTQNIFSYLGELKKAIKRLNDINERLPNEGRIVLPDSYIRSRLIRAARQVPIYKPVLDRLLITPMTEWTKMTSDELFHQLEAVCANDQAVSSARNSSSSYQTNSFDTLSANSVQFKERAKEKYPKNPCRNYAKGVPCSINPCKYSHSQAPEQKQSVQTTPKPRHCNKCDASTHWSSECKYDGKCGKCGNIGHKETSCLFRNKNGYKPRANYTQADGYSISANMISVQEKKEDHAKQKSVQVYSSISNQPPQPPGTVREVFQADTGATRTLHPNGRSAATFSRVSLEIKTACIGNSMRSEGVGSMKLYTHDGKLFPGFNNVVFAKQCAQKLASVGEICDAGMVCVFDKNGLSIFGEKDIKIEGKIFTRDERDKKTRLFPLSLFRKINEKNYANSIILSPSLASDYEKKAQRENEKIQIEKMPELVVDCESLPVALLSKTYVKDGLSQVERYHAKCGDVGIKYLKRAFPSLSIPKNFRCEFCIEGKIHKFGHGPCKPGRRTEYQPGVCIHTDHSGPYARSYGGARYSQLFMDRGSGFLWAFRMNKKTGHYQVTPRVFLDSQALSGRPVQIFHSDGDGVFSSQETTDLLAKEKIRHEFSAPYDSNTNPFVERARRTLFEGVSTALLRSGAPTSFWGEAECHKVFTINNLPTEEDPHSPGKFLSKTNLLVGDKRLFNLERLMAFGTATTCYVPIEKRRGGKGPAQRRSFKGVLLGYVENMPAYRIWNLEAKKIVSVSFNFTICHEGYYPFRDKTQWPPECVEDPEFFSPTVDGVISTIDFEKFKFDTEETSEIFSLAPGLVVDRL